jgi:hypothetical protein
MLCCTLTTSIGAIVVAQAPRETRGVTPNWHTLKMGESRGSPKAAGVLKRSVEKRDGKWKIVGFKERLVSKP